MAGGDDMPDFIGLQAMDRRITELDERLAAHIVAQVQQIKDSLELATKSQAVAVEAVDAHLREVFDGVQGQIDRRLTELDRRATEGDIALSTHIESQVGQITAAVDAQKDRVALALQAAEDLEIERLSALGLKIESVRREVTLIQEAAAEAIAKAEVANEKRFASVNEFRQQLNDQHAQFLPRETFQSTLDAWTQWRTTVDARLNQQVGGERREREVAAKIQPWHLAIASFTVTVIVALCVFVANLLTAAPG